MQPSNPVHAARAAALAAPDTAGVSRPYEFATSLCRGCGGGPPAGLPLREHALAGCADADELDRDAELLRHELDVRARRGREVVE